MGEPLMREAHRLCPLEMGIARQNCVDVLTGALEEYAPHFEQRALRRQTDFAEIQRQIRCNLVIARPTRMQLAATGPRWSRSRASMFMWMSSKADRRETCRPRSLWPRVRVRPRAPGHLRSESVQCGQAFGPVPSNLECRDGECLVVMNRRTKALDRGISRFAEPSTPGFAGFFGLLGFFFGSTTHGDLLSRFGAARTSIGSEMLILFRD